MAKNDVAQVPDVEVQAPAESVEQETTLGAVLDAVKELTTQVANLASEWQKWRAAGKF